MDQRHAGDLCGFTAKQLFIGDAVPCQVVAAIIEKHLPAPAARHLALEVGLGAGPDFIRAGSGVVITHAAHLVGEIPVTDAAEKVADQLRAIRAAPQRVGVLRGINPRPAQHERRCNAKAPQDLRKLPDVAELVLAKSCPQGFAAHFAAKRGANLKIADERLARDKPLVGLDVPRASVDAARRHKRAQFLRSLRSHFEVVD